MTTPIEQAQAALVEAQAALGNAETEYRAVSKALEDARAAQPLIPALSRAPDGKVLVTALEHNEAYRNLAPLQMALHECDARLKARRQAVASAQQHVNKLTREANLPTIRTKAKDVLEQLQELDLTLDAMLALWQFDATENMPEVVKYGYQLRGTVKRMLPEWAADVAAHSRR